ncbi:MAG: hypothetical protein LAT67_06680 [Balneolales bacterium]|nr:hypothetical protein [Balneolales bacterium]
MRKILLVLLFPALSGFWLMGCNSSTPADSSDSFDNGVHTVELTDSGWKFFVNDQPLMINGVNWDYFPIGTNYEYVIWEESDDLIKRALDHEMTLLQEIGVNAIRVYTGITPRWIEYIYDNYGIYTMLNHSFGRYGLTIDGEWVGNTEYSKPAVRDILISEVRDLASEFRNTRGLLLYLLGNENNYGLFWGGAETEDIPVRDDESARRAKYMYRLFNEAALVMKEEDPTRPVALCNGDVLFMDLVVQEAPDVDIFGVNVYRGESFTDMFDTIRDSYNKPVLLTEFGADAFNMIRMEEDQECQARINKWNWYEIYANAAGFGKAENSIGGFTFQFSDGWWKSGQTTDLDVHNTTASWSNGGYDCDYVTGENNMNEEWFGIAAKGPTGDDGVYELYPRAAYFIQKEVHKVDVYRDGLTLGELRAFFEKISIEDALQKASEIERRFAGEQVP